MNVIKSNIDECCQFFDLYNQNKSKEKTSSQYDITQLNLIVSTLKEISSSFEPSPLSEIPTLCEAERRIFEFDSYCLNDIKNSNSSTLQTTAAICHSKASNLLLLIDKKLIDNFLKLDSNEQEILLADPIQAKAIKQAIRNPELNNSVRNSNNGDYLFHELCRSRSFAVNQLAIECVNGGFNINIQKQNGATVLHLAVINDNLQLLKLLLDHGANPKLKTSPDMGNYTPLEFAISTGKFSSALLLLLAQPEQKVNNKLAPVYFIDQARNLVKDENALPLLFELMSKFSNMHDSKDYSRDLWAACQSVLEENQWSGSTPEVEQFLDEIMSWILTNTPKMIPPSREQISCVNELALRICSRGLSGPQDIQIIKGLTAHDLLPAVAYLTIDPETSVLNVLRKSPLLPNDIQNTLSSFIHDDGLRACREIDSIFIKLNTTYSSVDSFDLINKLDENFNRLNEMNFPLIEDLKNKIDNKTSHLREATNKLSELIKNLKNGSLTVNNLGGIDIYELTKYAALKQEWEIVAKLNIMKQHQISQVNFKEDDLHIFQSTDEIKLMAWQVNKLIFHFMLDKLAMPKDKDYSSFYAQITAYSMINAFTNMTKNEKLNLISSEILPINLEDFNNKLNELLSEYILMCEMNPELASKKTLERLQNMKPGKGLLIPTGCIGHAASLLVEKNESGTFKITQYNTGQGVLDWHARWENSTRYQTHYIIDNIPMESILNKKAWEAIYRDKEFEGDMNSTYINIRDNLGKGGTVLPPSKHKEDYEAKQASGTCAMQALMALLRHQCMQMVSGSLAEKEAVYKMIKTNLFISYHQDNLTQVDEVIQEHLPTVLRKLKAEVKLVEIAQREEQFNEAMNEIGSLLNQMGKQEIFQQLSERSFDTTMARYATLRAASTILCEIWLENPNLTLPSNLTQLEVFELGFAKLEHHKAIIQNIQTRLYNSAQKTHAELSFELYRILIATPYEDMGITETIKYFGDEIPGRDGKAPIGMQGLLRSLRKFPVHTNHQVQKLVEQLKKNNKFELATWVRNYWEELAESAPITVKTFD